ncbi:hypothetical protein DFH07DRAFT_759526, partial [Mycena maculata]
PLKTWYPHNDKYVKDQLLREGRGPPSVYSHCATRDCPHPADFHCVDQACIGHIMHCARCILSSHAQLPTHFIEVSEWTGTHFKRSRTRLHNLGLRVQLGHPPGVVCPFKWAAPHDFVLYDLPGVHDINVDFCGCLRQVHSGDSPGPDGEGVWRDVQDDFAWEEVPIEDVHAVPHRPQLLQTCWWPGTVRTPNTCSMFALCQLFQIINCLGKLSAYDFLWGLEQCTNHDGLDKPPVSFTFDETWRCADGEQDRQKPFMLLYPCTF